MVIIYVELSDLTDVCIAITSPSPRLDSRNKRPQKKRHYLVSLLIEA